jgi:hypothetical protein
VEAEFEEKEYEGPLNQELLSGDPRLWPPGQVFEKYMGIDAALMVASPLFWQSLGFSNSLPGTILNDLRFGYIWTQVRRKRRLPTFATNLFLQVKRPEYLSRSNCSVRMYGDHYRFNIKAHQQTALGRLARNLSHRGLVAYASPVFHTHERLFRLTERRELVTNSNFAPIHRLDGHSRWLYNRSGATGVAHSEPEQIAEPSFSKQLDQLEVMSAEFDNRRQDTTLDDLQFLAKSMYASARESSESSPISREFLRRSEHLLSAETEPIALQTAKLFAQIVMFCQMFGLHWHVVSSESAGHF